MNWSNYECEGQMSIFDLLDQNEEGLESIFLQEILEENEEVDFEKLLKNCLLKYGTGFVNGKVKVQKILRSNKTEKQKQDEIKSAFGMGGFSCSPREDEYKVFSLETLGSNMRIKYNDTEGNKMKMLTWSQVYKYIKKWDDAGEYFDSIFYPEDIIIQKHYFCNGSMYLKIAPEAKIYTLPDMQNKNLYIFYNEEDGFNLVSVTDAAQYIFEATYDEEAVIRRVAYDYGYNCHGYGIWEVFRKRIMKKDEVAVDDSDSKN